MKFFVGRRSGEPATDSRGEAAGRAFAEIPESDTADEAAEGISASPDAQRFSAIDLRSSLASAIRSVMRHAPRSEGASEDVVKTVTSQISAASDDVVDAAADLLKHGSRSTVFGILAGTLLLGWLIGRSGRPPKFN